MGFVKCSRSAMSDQRSSAHFNSCDILFSKNPFSQLILSGSLLRGFTLFPKSPLLIVCPPCHECERKRNFNMIAECCQTDRHLDEEVRFYCHVDVKDRKTSSVNLVETQRTNDILFQFSSGLTSFLHLLF